MYDLAYFQAIAEQMVAADRERDRMLRAMDDMWHNRWALPPNVAGLKWIHKVVSSDPHDAIRAGTRVLSSVAPRLTVQPLGAGEGGRARAEQVERALAWTFRNASRRRQASVLRDVVLSALLYDEVVAQVVYLPEQVDAQKLFKVDGLRLDAAGRFGPFAIIVRNPQQVHVRYSDWMPEAVLMKKVMRLQEAVDFWGEQANALVDQTEKPKQRKGASGAREKGSKSGLEYCTVYDYMDLEQRAVWAVLQADGGALAEPQGSQEGGAVEILREAHGLGYGGSPRTHKPLVRISILSPRLWLMQIRYRLALGGELANCENSAIYYRIYPPNSASCRRAPPAAVAPLNTSLAGLRQRRVRTGSCPRINVGVFCTSQTRSH